MDTLKNKNYITYNYLNRYTTVPYYYDTLRNMQVFGIGTNLNKNTESFLYVVGRNESLDSIALKYYNNPTFWWVIAYFNDLLDSLEPLEPGTTLRIPAIASIEFGADR